MARVNAKTNGKTRKSNGAAQADVSLAAYDTFKEFEGKKYTGMKIGRGHKWQYEPGEWVEKKITPDKWEFHYAVTKRRRGKAPEGSGVPVGTEYHWYILAHQTAKKLDANSYSTDMAGLKYKLSHKRADKETWSASDQAQRRRLIKILKDMIAELESAPAEIASAAKAKAEPKAKAKVKPKTTAKAARPKHRHLAAA
jgi:hypothetical protein